MKSSSALCTFLIVFFSINASNSQVGIGTNTPSPSAQLDISSTERGFLMPRMTMAQRNLIASPATGLTIYQTDNTAGFYFFDGSNWVTLGASGVDGKNTLIKTTTETAGSNCTSGGVKQEYGLDANSNGILDVSEVNSAMTKYVCNGAIGSTGIQGIGVSNTTIINDSLLITLTNGQILNAGYVGFNNVNQSSGSILYWNGTNWTPIVSGGNGTVLTMQNGVPTWGAPTLPVVITQLATKTNYYSSEQFNTGGDIISDGGGVILSKGVCYSTLPNPTINNQSISSGNGFGSYSCIIPNLEPHTLYYYRAFVTTNIGTAYGNQYTITTDSLSINDFYKGGVVVYIDSTFNHGLISQINDNNPVGYGCSNTFINNTSHSYGSGPSNTLAFISQCSTISAPCRKCNDLIQNGFSDWYLPSIGELEVSVDNLPSGEYWSSSQHSSTSYQYVGLSAGNNNYTTSGKGIAGGEKYRCYRSF